MNETKKKTKINVYTQNMIHITKKKTYSSENKKKKKKSTELSFIYLICFDFNFYLIFVNILFYLFYLFYFIVFVVFVVHLA